MKKKQVECKRKGNCKGYGNYTLLIFPTLTVILSSKQKSIHFLFTPNNVLIYLIICHLLAIVLFQKCIVVYWYTFLQIGGVEFS